VAAGGLYLANAVPVIPPTRALPTCTAQATLTPVEQPGWPWQEHRLTLEATVDVPPGAIYYIVETRSAARFQWLRVKATPGSVRFAVQTRWVLFHPNWTQGLWVLHYACTA
jgi:hypothetical protein